MGFFRSFFIALFVGLAALFILTAVCLCFIFLF